MRDLRFEWDARKEAQNRRKHGVSFAEAETSFRMSMRCWSTMRIIQLEKIGSFFSGSA